VPDEKTRPIPVQIVLFDGFDPLDAVAPYEVFWAVELLAPARADIVVVPGAVGPVGDPNADTFDERSIPAILARTLQTDLPSFLAGALASPACTLVCVCGGSLIPAMAGLLEGRHAVTHHLGMDLLDATGTCAVPSRVVDDGDLITSGGVTSGLDVAISVVERFVGPKVAQAIEKLFEFERRGVVWRDVGPTPIAAM